MLILISEGNFNGHLVTVLWNTSKDLSLTWYVLQKKYRQLFNCSYLLFHIEHLCNDTIYVSWKTKCKFHYSLWSPLLYSTRDVYTSLIIQILLPKAKSKISDIFLAFLTMLIFYMPGKLSEVVQLSKLVTVFAASNWRWHLRLDFKYLRFECFTSN